MIICMIDIIKLHNTFMFNIKKQNTSDLKSVQITFTIGDFKVLYSVPKQWSINKTKCLLASQIPKLKFDEFELMHSGKLIKGDTKINDVCSTSPALSFIVIQSKSQISFQQYYRKTMESFIAQSTHNYEPVMQPAYQKVMKNLQIQQSVDKLAAGDLLELNQALQNRQNLQDLPQLFKILRLFGLTMFLSVILIRGEAYQIALLLIIFCSHYLIDVYRAYCKKNEKINKKNKEKQQENAEIVQKSQEPSNQKTSLNNIKAEILIRFYKAMQIIFCFILTFYPNWDLRLHFNINGNRIVQWRNQINKLRPNSYPNSQKLI